MKERRFKSAADVHRWIKDIQSHIAWEDNTGTAPTFVETRVAYPIHLKLPKQVRMWGPVLARVQLPADALLNESSALLKAMRPVVSAARKTSVLIEYLAAEKNVPSNIGFQIDRNGSHGVFQTSFSFKDVEATRLLYAEFFKALDIPVGIRKVTKAKSWIRGRARPICDYGIDEAFRLVPGRNVKLEAVYPGPAMLINPTKVTVSCGRIRAEEILLKIGELVRRMGWRVRNAHLRFEGEGDKFSGHRERGHEFIQVLNNARFPCRKIDLEVWYALSSWREFPILASMTVKDVEKQPAEVNILRIDLGQGLRGFISVTATAKTFTTCVFASDEVSNDESARGRFFAEWGKRFAHLKK